LVSALMVGKQRPKRIMLVDDDEAVAEVVGIGLRKKGYRVNSFNDPSVALASFAPHSYDVAVLDIRMGPFDGLELYRRLKGLDPRLDFLFLSAYADVVKDRPDRIRFLQKPISLVDLVRALENI
jgi:DNA-binding NtrC family response regulator